MNIQVVENFSEEDLLLIPNNKRKYYRFHATVTLKRHVAKAETVWFDRYHLF